jgi:hypothetical protein
VLSALLVATAVVQGILAWVTIGTIEPPSPLLVRTTAATFCSTIWLAQSRAVAGSSLVLQTTKSTGRPAIPPRLSLA